MTRSMKIIQSVEVQSRNLTCCFHLNASSSYVDSYCHSWSLVHNQDTLLCLPVYHLPEHSLHGGPKSVDEDLCALLLRYGRDDTDKAFYAHSHAFLIRTALCTSCCNIYIGKAHSQTRPRDPPSSGLNDSWAGNSVEIPHSSVWTRLLMVLRYRAEMFDQGRHHEGVPRGPY